MDQNHRYSESEIAEIFERATATAAQEPAGRSPLSGDGLTLGELQEIGREVGISSDLITHAALTLHDADPAALRTRKFLGTPIGVSRTVHLPRRLTNQEWARLVVDLRETFDARGRIGEEGPFRQWTNGNLQALLEPTESGERLRLGTLRTGAREALGMGATLLVLAPLALVLSLTRTLDDPGLLTMIASLALAGGVLYGSNRIRLPKWAETRKLQMDGVAARLTAAITEADEAESVEES